MGETVFLAPFIHVLSVIEKFRKPSREQAAAMRRLPRWAATAGGPPGSDFGFRSFGFRRAVIGDGRHAPA